MIRSLTAFRAAPALLAHATAGGGVHQPCFLSRQYAAERPSDRGDGDANSMPSKSTDVHADESGDQKKGWLEKALGSRLRNAEEQRKAEARLRDDFDTSSVAQIKQLNKTSGKVFEASTSLTSRSNATTFPALDAVSRDGAKIVFPPLMPQFKAALVGIALRQGAQDMLESFMDPFAVEYEMDDKVQLFEVSMVESTLMSWGPMRKMLIDAAAKALDDAERPGKPPQLVFTFGSDFYDIKKPLGISNSFSAFTYLLDSSGRVRWQASGRATEEELRTLLECTQKLLDGE